MYKYVLYIFIEYILEEKRLRNKLTLVNLDRVSIGITIRFMYFDVVSSFVGWCCWLPLCGKLINEM